MTCVVVELTLVVVNSIVLEISAVVEIFAVVVMLSTEVISFIGDLVLLRVDCKSRVIKRVVVSVVIGSVVVLTCVGSMAFSNI